MNESDTEKKLKEEADKIRMEDFSSRFEKIQQREKSQRLLQQETASEAVPVLEQGSEFGMIRHKPNKMLIISIAFAVLCLLALAIVLPLTLNKKSPTGFGKVELSSLHRQISNKEEFYRELQATDIIVPDLSECEVETYGLILLAEDNTIKGGYVDYYDERSNSFVGLEIYTVDVEVKNDYYDFDSKCETVTIRDTTVRYLILESDGEGAYRMQAIASDNRYNYKFELISDNENILSVFESLFA